MNNFITKIQQQSTILGIFMVIKLCIQISVIWTSVMYNKKIDILLVILDTCVLNYRSYYFIKQRI